MATQANRIPRAIEHRAQLVDHSRETREPGGLLLFVARRGDGWLIADPVPGSIQVRTSPDGYVQWLKMDREGEWDGVRIDRNGRVTEGHGASADQAYKACRPAGQRG